MPLNPQADKGAKRFSLTQYDETRLNGSFTPQNIISNPLLLRSGRGCVMPTKEEKELARLDREIRRGKAKLVRAEADLNRTKNRVAKARSIMATVAKGAATRKQSGRLGNVAGWPTRPATIRIAVADRGGALARYTHRIDKSGEPTTRDEELESCGGVDLNEFERQATALETTIPLDAPHRSPAYGIIVDQPYETTEEKGSSRA